MKRSMRRQSLPLDRQGVVKEGAAPGQQFPLQLQLGQTAFPCLGMGEALGLGVEVVHCRGPSGQLGVFGVERLQVMDVPEQMGPTPLLRTRIVVIGSVEIADQHPR